MKFQPRHKLEEGRDSLSSRNQCSSTDDALEKKIKKDFQRWLYKASSFQILSALFGVSIKDDPRNYSSQ